MDSNKMTFDEIYKICEPYTMTSPAKMKNLHDAVTYLNKNNTEGSFVECGVFRGGSVMNMALTQLQFEKLRHIYLFDTFEGMTPHTKHDVNWRGVTAERILRNPKKLCVASLLEVKSNVEKTNYPNEFLHFRKGDVVNTLKGDVPQKIALLRLDTDWYESTRICLEILYPKLVPGGVLILDDYGYWKGARKAADEYFASIGKNPKLKPMESGISGVIYTKND